MNKRFLLAMAVYAILALLAAFTVEGVIQIAGMGIDLRVGVWIILAGFALKTWIAHKAGW